MTSHSIEIENSSVRFTRNEKSLSMQLAEKILKKLADYPQQEGVQNPYINRYALTNLRHYFEYMLKQTGKRVLLVGEAPGYKGCCITGIPFTSGKVFKNVSHQMLQELKTKILLPSIVGESTATIVWNYLATKDKTPLFWNSFPFHPYRTGNPASNRPPTNVEIKIGSQILAEIIELYQPELIAGIGHKGIKALEFIFPTQTFTYIRHPSNGGKMKFIKGMDNIL